MASRVLKAGLTAFLTASVALVTRGASARAVQVMVPERDNLQWMAFWYAKAGGFFEREGITVELLIPANASLARAMVREKDPDVMVLPTPTALDLVSDGHRFAIVANLLDRDPINLVVAKATAEKRGLTGDLPFATRVEKLRGLRIGVAPGPPPRLRALLGHGGLDAGGDAQLVLLGGREQNAALHDGKVDALYAHTPFLERALIDDGAVLVVHSSGADDARAITRQVHTLAVAERIRDGAGDTPAALVRAIGKAEARLHEAPGEAVEALRREFSSVDVKYIERIVAIYEPAIPRSTHVSAEGLRAGLAWYPAHRAAPDLAKTKLEAWVDDRWSDPQGSASPKAGAVVEFGVPATRANAPPRWTSSPQFRAMQVGAIVLVVARIAWAVRRHRKASRELPPG